MQFPFSDCWMGPCATLPARGGQPRCPAAAVGGEADTGWACRRQRPELADSLSGILERRLQRFAELEQGYSAGQNELGQRIPGSAAIGRKIRGFFGLD